jgi:lysophospholipase L1-like esterase/fibronectin type 3 domain-containing protein
MKLNVMNLQCVTKLSHRLLIRPAWWPAAIAGCLLGSAVPVAAAPDGSLTDTNIQYFGRWDFSSSSQYVSYWGGAYIRVLFSGTTVKVKLGNTSNFYVKLDRGSWTTYTNVTGLVNLTPTPLASGIHSVSVAQGRDYDYLFNFQGLVLDAGATTGLPSGSGNLIEFIGDSITAGYTDPQADVSDYAWVCAEKMNCEHTQIAYPGVDLCTTTNHGPGMDAQYFKAQSFNYPAAPDWDFSRYTPRLVVINLGQNDIGANGIPLDQYQTNYIAFLANIRARFPRAEIFALRVFLGFGAAQVQAAVTARNAAGDTQVHYVDTTGWISSGTSDYTTGDGVHPSAAGQVKIANQLKAVLTRYLGGDVVGKVTVGYQGWFSAAGDGSPLNAWGHDNLEMWPEVSEYATTYAGTPFAQAGVTQPNFYGPLGNGQPATMFSAYDQQVVNTHFRWLAENNLDCVALQRFANEISPGSTIKAQRDGMALKVMNAARATGRKFFIEYDASGRSTMDSDIQADWTNTIINTLHLTDSPAYARQNGKPVVGVYGMGYATAPDPGPGSTNDCLELIGFLQAQGCYVMGGVPGQWRTGTGDSRTDFTAVYRAIDLISPWAVGRAADATYLPYLTADLANCITNGMDYLPNAYPGTSFHNSNAGSPTNQFPRNAGQFLWTQLADMQSIGAPSVFIAMFDELNEATSIFKCAEDATLIPTNYWFLTLDADGTHCSSDFYLRLVKDGADMLKGQRSLTMTLPTLPVLPVAAPTAPNGLTATGSNGQVVLGWTAVPGAASYNVQRAAVSGGPYAVVATQVGHVAYTDTSLTNGATYYYVVSTVNSLGESPNSREVAGTPASPVASASAQNLPAEGAAMAFDGSTTTKWFNANAGNVGWLQYYFGGVTKVVVGYTLTSANDVPGRDPENWQFQGSPDGSIWTTLDTRTGEAFSNRGWSQSYFFTNSSAYAFYRLNITANHGDPTGIQLAEMAFVFATEPPGDLSATAFSASQIVLAWTPVADATGYDIKRAQVDGGPYLTIATNLQAPFYWDGGLSPNTTWFYVVAAANPTGESPNSAPVSATTSAAPPPVVTGLSANAANTQVTLNWTASFGATNYNVKRATTEGGPYAIVGSLGSTVFTNLGLINDTTYYFVVTAVGPGGESANSAEVNSAPSANATLDRTGWIASASGGEPAAYGIDGNLNTRWSTDALQVPGQWYQVNMQTQNTFRRIVLDTTPSPNDYPRAYQVNLSQDGANWGNPVATGNGTSAVTTITFPATQAASYFRITQTGSTPGNYWSIHELNVYGAAPASPARLQATAGEGKTFLNWTVSVGATGYNLKSAFANEGPYATFAYDVPALPYTNGGLANGSLYYYVVSATNLFGESGDSLPSSARPVSLSPPMLDLTLSNNLVQLSWPADHTGWRLEAQTDPLDTGLGANWFTISNSDQVNNISLPAAQTNGCVFHRLVYP